MTKSTKRQLRFLKEDFLRASSTWPSLHHAFIQLDMGVDIGGVGELNFFLETWPKTVVAPITGKRVILESAVSVHDSLASGRLGITVYIDDPPGDPSCLRYFQELSLGACRYFFPKAAAQFSNAYGHSCFLPDKWLGEVYTLGLEHRDPLLTVRSHLLEVHKNGSEFCLAPGYSCPMPEGDAIGLGGRSRPWKDLLTDLARLGTSVDVLEAGVFRASAYVLEQVISDKWCIGATPRKSKRGRPHDPKVAERNNAIITEYLCNRQQSYAAIARKVAPKFPGLSCGRDQVRKAIQAHNSLENATGKK